MPVERWIQTLSAILLTAGLSLNETSHMVCIYFSVSIVAGPSVCYSQLDEGCLLLFCEQIFQSDVMLLHVVPRLFFSIKRHRHHANMSSG